MALKCTLIGSRYFGATVLAQLLEDGHEVVRVVANSADDRLALAAQKAGLPLTILESPRKVPGDALQEDCDLIVAAHTHAFVTPEALARARIGSIGYHPSLLPRHRGIAAVEWTLLAGDPIAGGSIYHLDAGWDDGAIAAQDWCFVVKGESARDLWERALSPMGLRLIRQVVNHAAQHGSLPAHKQDPRFATKAHMIKRNVSLVPHDATLTTSLVVTVIGRDRPGIVRMISDSLQGLAVNWADSRMTHYADQFAGVVHLQVSAEQAGQVESKLKGLEAEGLSVQWARSDSPPVAAGNRMLRLELMGPDRPGIVRELSVGLAERGVSIEDLHTEISQNEGQSVFKVSALLVVPQALSDEALRGVLEGLASQMMMDIGLDGQA
ncbi:MAG: formyltransferase family protein [Alphaproteobacteria bacterium]|nr:formyltransferase family protein [Alphaproteobacteria bacterium]